MSYVKFILIVASWVCATSAKTIAVSNGAQLKSALNSVAPGDVIQLADGTYSGQNFLATRSGAAGKLITIQGSRRAVLNGNPYGFHLKASYWKLSGFSVANSLKGIVLDGSNKNVIENVEVRNIKQEGVHFRFNSADNVIRNSFIHDTGVRDKGYGEGVYIGSAVSNWQGGADKSDRNQVLNNRIGPNVAAESVDIKEGSCCGIVRGNTFVGGQSGANSADSWVDIKGTGYTVENNSGSNPRKDGIQLHRIARAGGNSGCNNVIQNNKCSGLPAGGRCVANDAGCANTIRNNG